MERAERDPRIGSVVEGRYRILDSMASGSMGVVYRAERVPVGKVVAIKFLHSAFASDPEFLGRFERETRVMSKLAHPHCVSVVDFGVTEGAPYLVMDYVAGVTLGSVLDDGPLPVPRALAFARQILAGLAHAHEQGIVHRDIKPANLMITEEIGTGEHVRILDFGLARLRNAAVNATQTHVVVGTPSYMAPEQTLDAKVDLRADLYAVGVVLFEMVTGDRPFQADETLELLAKHRGAAIPRLAEHVKPGTQIPAGLQGVIDRALAKDPDDRFQNAIEFAAALDGLGAAAPQRASTALVEPRRPRTQVAWLLMILAPLLIGAGLWFVTREPTTASSRSTARRPRAVVPGTADAAIALAAPRDAGAVASVSIDAGVGSTADAGAIPAAVELDAAVAVVSVDAAVAIVAAPDAGAVAVIFGDAGLDGIEVMPEPEPDPTIAEDPDPEGAAVAAGTAADEDEAPDAPAEVSEEETPKAPPKAVLARSVNEAVRMIRAGKRELALQSLRMLWRKHPGSGYIPFLLGNLYFDKRWWSVAMERYRIAIKKNARYRHNSTLNRNVIRMLSSPKNSKKASWFLRKTIGHPAKAYVKRAAKHDPNAKVRKLCASIAKRIR
jgi:serine/threonine-protein kinase